MRMSSRILIQTCLSMTFVDTCSKPHTHTARTRARRPISMMLWMKQSHTRQSPFRLKSSDANCVLKPIIITSLLLSLRSRSETSPRRRGITKSRDTKKSANVAYGQRKSTTAAGREWQITVCVSKGGSSLKNKQRRCLAVQILIRQPSKLHLTDREASALVVAYTLITHSQSDNSFATNICSPLYQGFWTLNRVLRYSTPSSCVLSLVCWNIPICSEALMKSARFIC
mmetsp:Transcript_19291/g.35462  ORF Transcript_19291/g.35462 Transcript_19291/m.35462 type:complete len:227 (-) Transcript_19291:5322-6002(-)